MNAYTPITPEIRQKISDAIGARSVFSSPEALASFDRDASELRIMPELVVRVDTVDQIRRLLELANTHRFPVTPRGGGSGLAGGCLAVRGGVVLSLAQLNRIDCIDPENLIARVQPGVITQTLRDAARRKGLFYPPDPAGMDQSTIGGNAATNAGGPACAKYGTTKDYILALDAVLPSGTLIRTGTQCRKGVVGYDLTHLIIGSEGTLGIITGLTLKLIPLPAAVTGMVAVFSDLEIAMQAVSAIMRNGYLPSAIEFLDAKCLKLVGDLLPFRVSGRHSSLLFIETDGDRDQIQRGIEKIGAICKHTGATHLLATPDDTDRRQIWEVRRQVSLRIHDSAALYFAEDVVVPIARIADLVNALPPLEETYGLYIYAFGHAGDGNIHLNVTAETRTRMDRVEAGIRAILAKVLELGGTISGEHGIGAAKMDYLPMEIEAESIRLQYGIKQLFDPQMILNPGKLFHDAQSR